jgi:hypothetical protein
MRRNEDMYQLNKSQAYRKYPGGDELIFLLQGSHKNAGAPTKAVKHAVLIRYSGILQ